MTNTQAASQSESGSSVDLLLVLGHVLLVRNFVADGFLRELVGRGFKVAVVAPDDTLPFIRRLSPGLVLLHPLSRFRPGRGRLRTLHRLRLGSFFARREASAYALKLAFAQKVSLDHRLTIAFWKIVARFSNPEQLARKWASTLRPRPSAVRLLQKMNPRLVVWPTTISDPVDFEIVQAATRLNVPLVMCEGSWDNLVSKGAIWPRPEQVLVWGEFSRRYAMAEHEFGEGKVVVTGPPHFGVYNRIDKLMPRAEWFARHGLDPAKRLILIAGSTIGHKVEPVLVRLMSDWINRGALPPAYIWYRPHPKIGNRFDAAQFAADPNVRIDPSIDQGEAGVGMNRLIDIRETRQRANGIAACDVIVSMFSTVVLEGALLGKPSLLVDLRTLKGVYQRPTSSFQGAAHVRYILQNPWIRLAPSPEALQPMLQEFLQLDPETIREPLRAFAQQVASCEPQPPQERIIQAIEDLLAREHSSEQHRNDQYQPSAVGQ